MRMIEMHEEQGWMTGQVGFASGSGAIGTAVLAFTKVNMLEHRIQSRINETGHGWNPSLRFGISDAERVYRVRHADA